jgi:hypothetical protein
MNNDCSIVTLAMLSMNFGRFALFSWSVSGFWMKIGEDDTLTTIDINTKECISLTSMLQDIQTTREYNRGQIDEG